VLGSVAFGWGWAWLDLPVSVETTHCEAMPLSIETTHCEALMTASGTDAVGEGLSTLLARRPSVRMRDRSEEDENLLFQLQRALRLIRRLFKLTIVFSPVVALYPLHWVTSRIRLAVTAAEDEETDAHQLLLQALDESSMAIGWYYQLCLYCVEYSGAACIKMMQWAGSRPDLFGRDFCAVFSKLQDSTATHAWKHTKKAMIDAYGKDWEDKIRLGEILGSGCIAQVYKGAVLDSDGTSRPVAVKVMHPNVEDDIDADLDIMRLSIRLLEDFGPVKDLKWLNLPGFIEEMAIMLKTQLDLRKEGENLVQFNKNFEGNPTVIFPKLIDGYEPTKRVLCETYCDGAKLMEFVKNNKADQKLLNHMCKEAIKAVCQMIFLGR
jgi:aarF domain-containing kinase